MQITVIDAFCVAGLRQEAGSTIDLPESAARELVQRGKAAVSPTPGELPPPATPHSVPLKKRKGSPSA